MPEPGRVSPAASHSATTDRGAVVVVNYASSQLLRTNLPGMADAGGDVRVVVVDNFSTHAERRSITALAAQHGWDLVTQANLGFAAGMNAGARHAIDHGCESLLLLNPDVTIAPTTVRALLSHVEVVRDALVTPRIRHADGTEGFARGTLDLARGTTRTRGPLDPTHQPWLSGACLALSVDLWQVLGGLAEEYFMYWEDIELSHRCQLLGGGLVVRADLDAVHQVGGTQGQVKSPLYLYYNCRNRLLFARRNVDRRDARGWLRSTPSYARRVLLRDGRRAVLRRPLTTVVPVVRGTMAGIRILLVGR